MISNGSVLLSFGRRDDCRTTPATRPELPQAVHGLDHLQPRRRDQPRRLPVAGVGGDPQSRADRPHRRRSAHPVAAVHAAGRRHHRPLRPAPADGWCQRHPLRAHRRCRPRRLRAPRRPPGARRRRRNRWHGLLAVRHVARRHLPARRVRGALRQQRPDDHAGPRHRRQSRKGQRAAVLGGGGGQPVRRATTGGCPARRLLRPAVRRRRRDVRRVGSARRRHHRAAPPATPDTWPRGRHGGQRSPRASAGSGITR